MKFLVDAQLPPALAEWLREAGHDAQPVRTLGLHEAEDGSIWRYAAKNGAVILTKDDFALRVQATESRPPVVWLRAGNTSNAALRRWLVPQLPEIVRFIERGARLVEVH